MFKKCVLVVMLLANSARADVQCEPCKDPSGDIYSLDHVLSWCWDFEEITEWTYLYPVKSFDVFLEMVDTRAQPMPDGNPPSTIVSNNVTECGFEVFGTTHYRYRMWYETNSVAAVQTSPKSGWVYVTASFDEMGDGVLGGKDFFYFRSLFLLGLFDGGDFFDFQYIMRKAKRAIRPGVYPAPNWAKKLWSGFDE